jgi:tetratricopeptide (TPR) repeat protein
MLQVLGRDAALYCVITTPCRASQTTGVHGHAFPVCLTLELSSEEEGEPVMTETAGFLIYAALFRLAIIGAGALSIWLGFRLFLQGTSTAEGGRSTDAEAKFGGVMLSLRGAAPGTCFALFGATIISVMIWTGSPALNLQESRGAGPDATARSLALKGAPVPASTPAVAIPQFGSIFQTQMLRGDALLTDGRYAEAADAYAAALADGRVRLSAAAPAFNQLAWSMHQLGRHTEAAGFADIAVGLAPENAVFRDTRIQARAAADRLQSEMQSDRQRAGAP